VPPELRKREPPELMLMVPELLMVPAVMLEMLLAELMFMVPELEMVPKLVMKPEF